MTKADVLQLAKKGDPKAIATLINRTLQPKGITARIARKESCLQILLEATQAPTQQAVVGFIVQGINNLKPQGVEVIKICGQQTGEVMPAWIQEISLKSALQSQPAAQQSNNQVTCPKCHSTQILASKQGFSGGNAVIGAVLLGPLGLAGGLIGANQIFLNCLKCGYQWQHGQPAPQIRLNRKPTQAEIKRMSILARLMTGIVAAVIGGGIIALLLGRSGLPFAIITFLGFAFGVDEFTAELKGECPYCGKELTASLNAASKTCEHCRNEVKIERQGEQRIFVPVD